MNVLFLTEEPITFSGTMVRGGQIHVRNVVDGLRDRGHDVHLVDWNAEPEADFQHPVTPKLRFVVDPIRTVRQAIRTGRDIDVDVIVSKTRKTYLPGLVTATILDVPHVIHVGSSLSPPTNGWVDRIDNASFASRIRLPHDAYMVVCNAIGEELQGRGVSEKKIFDVRNAVDTARFYPDTDVDLPKNTAALLEDDKGPLLGFVGGLVDYKGVFDLANAVQRSATDPTVVVVGDGPARNRLEQELGENGVFLGSVPYERMPAVYAATDALVLPSHTEGLPRVVLEAAATECPVIATRVGGVPEVVTEGTTGLLCPPHQPGRLARRIDQLFEEYDLATMGKAARKKVINEFTWASQYKRYERFLEAVIDDN